MNTKAHNWFKSKEELLAVCAEAEKRAEGEQNTTFAKEINKRSKAHGLELYMSEKQVRYLCRLAGCGVPLPRT